QAQQRSLDIAAHNIANANTPGFSRQSAIQQATSAYRVPGMLPVSGPGQIGTGVAVVEIMRYRDAFVETQLRQELQATGEWEARRETLERLELLLLEPTDIGLRSDFDAFWEALQDLHLHPESSSARAVVRQRAVALTETFQHLHRQLQDLQKDV